VTEAKYYILYRSDGGKPGKKWPALKGTEHSYNDAPAAKDRIYIYHVVTSDGNRESETGNEAIVKY